MIVGRVRNRGPVTPLIVYGTRGRSIEMEAVVDTGYTGWLTLPSELITTLRLRWDSFGQGTLADGSVVAYDVYFARVLWNGRFRRVRVND